MVLVPWSYVLSGGVIDKSIIPNAIVFRRQLGRPQSEVRVPVRNIGAGLLKIDAFSQDLQLSFRREAIEAEPGDLTVLRVIYRPEAGGSRAGTFSLFTNDPATPAIDISWTAPEGIGVVGVQPPDGAVDVDVESSVSIEFTEPVFFSPTYVGVDAALFPEALSGPLGGSFEVTESGRVVTFPLTLDGDVTYRLVVSGASGLGGASLESPFISAFSTGSAPSLFASLSGAVEGSNGVGSIFVFTDSGQLAARTEVQADGTFLVEGLSAGRYQVYAEVLDGSGTVFRGSVGSGGVGESIALLAGEQRDGLTIKLSAASAGTDNAGTNAQLSVSVPGGTASGMVDGVVPGDEILVWARIQNVEDLAGFLVRIEYDPAQFDVAGISESGPDGETNILRLQGGDALYIPSVLEGSIALSGATVGVDASQLVDGEGLLGVFRFQLKQGASGGDFLMSKLLLQSGEQETELQAGQLVAVTVGQAAEGPIRADLDGRAGDQNQTSLGGLSAGSGVTLQLFAEGLEPVTGIGLAVYYDAEFLQFTTGTASTTLIPGAFQRVEETGGRVEVPLASFGNAQTSQGDGLVAQLQFEITSTISDSTVLRVQDITLNLPDGQAQQIPQVLSAWLKAVPGGGCGADFNCSGVVDFVDFLLFASAFGGTNPTFDLDGDGSIGFGDFLLFADDFAKRT